MFGSGIPTCDEIYFGDTESVGRSYESPTVCDESAVAKQETASEYGGFVPHISSTTRTLVKFSLHGRIHAR